MREKIIVENFSVLEYIELDLNDINIITGRQASGKSVITKLIYYFKSIHEEFQLAIFTKGNRSYLYKLFREKFNKIFPQYLWQDKKFDIQFFFEEHHISINNKNSKTYKSLNIEVSDELLKKFNSLKQNISKNNKSKIGFSFFPKTNPDLLEIISNEFQLFLYGTAPVHSFFIPAGRSFFANLQHNLHSLLSESVSFEYLLNKFGAFLQDTKNKYLTIKKDKIDKTLLKLCEEVMNGYYEYDRKDDWVIDNKKRKVLLKDSSSGQQEISPLIISLIVLSQYTDDNFFLFIEEPETHLFADTQRKIVEILNIVFNLSNKKNKFFITTHSEHILNTYNFFMSVDNLDFNLKKKLKKGEMSQEDFGKIQLKLNKIANTTQRVSSKNISTSVVHNGKIKNILIKTKKQIDIQQIMNVSKDFEENLIELNNLQSELKIKKNEEGDIRF